MRKLGIFLLICALLAGCAAAEQPTLEERVAALEERVAALEQLLAGSQAGDSSAAPQAAPEDVGVLMTDDSVNSNVLGSDILRSEVTSITFADSLAGAPADAWDASTAQDGSVLAWFADGALTIAAEGGVIAPNWMYGQFAGYTALTAVHFNGCLDTSQTEGMYTLFEGCHALAEIDLSGLDTGSVTEMSGMFDNCWALKDVDLSALDLSRVENANTMFYGCIALERADFSGFDLSSLRNVEGMFNKCESLVSVDFSGARMGPLSSTGYMFSDCKNLTEVDVSSFDTTQTTSLNGMFMNCASLKSLDISNFDTRAAESIVMMFSGCESLTELKLGENFVPGAGTEAWGVYQDSPLEGKGLPGDDSQ